MGQAATSWWVKAWRRYLWWVDPRTWGIPVRSALAAAAVVLVSFMVVGAAVVAVLYRQLLSDVDAAAERRARDVVAGLQVDPVPELDAGLLATDGQIVAVQVVDDSGEVVRSSPGAPDKPMLSRSDGEEKHGEATAEGEDGSRLRVSEAAGQRDGRRYTVLVAAGSAAVNSTVRNLGLLLAAAMPFVVGGAAAANFVLVRRSLRSVEAIRAQVADISSHDLSGRVPVPLHRDEVAALAITMNEMLERIESGQAAQRRFVGDASHELRSPLATIISALEVGVAHPELPQTELAQDLVLPEAHRMRTLIDDLLMLARADERGMLLRRQDVDVDDLAAEQVRRLDTPGEVRLQTDLQPARVLGDPAALGRVLRNLLDNAVRHARSTVHVAVWRQDALVFVTVADDGPGIAVADRARVFERFVRLEEDRSRAAGGSGLGLAIVAEIVVAHGGSVTATERGGGGTVMTVQLPAGSESSR